MKTNLWILAAAAMTSALSSACTGQVVSDEDTSESASELRVLNGDRLSGVTLTGTGVGNAVLNGVNYSGITISGLPITNVSINGTTITGKLGSVTISGDDFIGAEMTGTMSNNSSISLRIDDIAPSADPDILHYTVSYYQASSQTWLGLCGTSGGSNVAATALAGRWDTSVGTSTGGSFINDSSRFTIACRGAAIAKCAEFGYKPWQTKVECTSGNDCHTVSLRSLHQACTRMIRADYCGDGQSHTVLGTEVDLFDGLGIKDEDSTAQYALEAEWTSTGAQCVRHVRWGDAGYGKVDRYIADHCSAKWAPPSSSVACGTEDSTFFTDNGFETPDASRAILRNKSQEH